MLLFSFFSSVQFLEEYRAGREGGQQGQAEVVNSGSLWLLFIVLSLSSFILCVFLVSLDLSTCSYLSFFLFFPS